MKIQIILPLEKTTAFVLDSTRNLNTECYYGFFNPLQKRKGFITREFFEGGNYIAQSTNRLTQRNCYSHAEFPTLEGCVIALLSNTTDPMQVYSFKTAKELFTWLAED